MPCERPLQSSQSPQNLVPAPEGGALIASGFTARVGRAGGARTRAPSPVPTRTATRCYAEPAEVIRRATPGQDQAADAGVLPCSSAFVVRPDICWTTGNCSHVALWPS